RAGEFFLPSVRVKSSPCCKKLAPALEASEHAPRLLCAGEILTVLSGLDMLCLPWVCMYQGQGKSQSIAIRQTFMITSLF
ncbi:hypothetical protein COT48_03615, partial [Candidatus Woesearchaeota archaeon CG08_land_8_20_14_0_20_47_9]